MLIGTFTNFDVCGLPAGHSRDGTLVCPFHVTAPFVPYVQDQLTTADERHDQFRTVRRRRKRLS